MHRGLRWSVVGSLLLAVAGCGFYSIEQRPAWRGEAERACLRAGYIKPSPYIVRIKALNGAHTCGMDYPLRVAAIERGTVGVSPNVTVGCPMLAGLEGWVRDVVEPQAQTTFGQ